MRALAAIPLISAAIAGLAAPSGASAHEVLHSIERNRAIAVKAYFADGEALASAQYEVFSPADPEIPTQTGRTDRSGWLAFVPDVAGKWRVKIADDHGHGHELEVEAGTPGTATAALPAGPAASSAALVLRPLVGLAAIGAVFAVLFAVYRRKGAGP